VVIDINVKNIIEDYLHSIDQFIFRLDSNPYIAHPAGQISTGLNVAYIWTLYSLGAINKVLYL